MVAYCISCTKNMNFSDRMNAKFYDGNCMACTSAKRDYQKLQSQGSVEPSNIENKTEANQLSWHGEIGLLDKFKDFRETLNGTAIPNPSGIPAQSNTSVKNHDTKAISTNDTATITARETGVLLVELFKMQALIIGKSKGEEYLKSDFSIGLVAGFIDAFLQKTQGTMMLSSAKQQAIMESTIALVFMDIDTEALPRFYDLQKRGDRDFMAGQMKGGQSAFDYLNDLSNSKAQRCWCADFTEKYTSQDNISVAASEALASQLNTDAEGYAVTLSQHIRSSLNRFENDRNEVEMPRYIIEDPYFSGFVVGYLAIVIDGMEREQNKTKDDRGLFSIEFYRRFDRDIGTQLVKLLEDLDFAKVVAQHPTFQEGRDHGSLWAAHYFGLARQKLHDHLLKTAKEMSERDGIDLANCLFILTFFERYKR